MSKLTLKILISILSPLFCFLLRSYFLSFLLLVELVLQVLLFLVFFRMDFTFVPFQFLLLLFIFLLVVFLNFDYLLLTFIIFLKLLPLFLLPLLCLLHHVKLSFLHQLIIFRQIFQVPGLFLAFPFILAFISANFSAPIKPPLCTFK